MPPTTQYLLPGERLVAGRPYIFNLDIRGDFLACMAKAEAPVDLTSLTDDEVCDLKYPAMRLYDMSGDRDDFLPRVSAELARRGFDSAGRRVILAQRVAA